MEGLIIHDDPTSRQQFWEKIFHPTGKHFPINVGRKQTNRQKENPQKSPNPIGPCLDAPIACAIIPNPFGE
jgi:hypothetical protein